MRGDRLPRTRDLSWVYRLTIMRGGRYTPTEAGNKRISEARAMIGKGEKVDAKWYVLTPFLSTNNYVT